MTTKEFKRLQSTAPCWCTPREQMDMCGHADSSVDCPRHSEQGMIDYVAEELEEAIDAGYASGPGWSEPARLDR